jgi:hypothetical protein
VNREQLSSLETDMQPRGLNIKISSVYSVKIKNEKKSGSRLEGSLGSGKTL